MCPTLICTQIALVLSVLDVCSVLFLYIYWGIVVVVLRQMPLYINCYMLNWTRWKQMPEWFTKNFDLEGSNWQKNFFFIWQKHRLTFVPLQLLRPQMKYWIGISHWRDELCGEEQTGAGLSGCHGKYGLWPRVTLLQLLDWAATPIRNQRSAVSTRKIKWLEA